MAQVAVTFVYGSKIKKDLALPDDVPSQFLAEAIARSFEKAIDLPSSRSMYWLLAVREANGSQRLSPASSLADEEVCCGSYVELLSEALPDGPRAYLRSDTGVKFYLKNTSQVGRKDQVQRTDVDIDLMPLAAEKVISRQHALISLKGGQYYVEDNSRHGTWVNGQKISAPTLLHHGDEILFGPQGRGVVVTFIIDR